MRVLPTALPGVLILEPRTFSDERGFFFESFNQSEFDQAVGYHVDFLQDNHSRSRRSVLRGLHYQLPPHAQGKLVRVVCGWVFDVAVDLRRDSPTCGRWFGQELSDSNRLQLWIPPGFAHGFLVLSDYADFLYKTTAYYSPESERTIRWDDPNLGIAWPACDGGPRLSARDLAAPSFKSAPLFEFHT